MSFTRALKYQLPMMRGQDVLDLQLRLKQLNYDATGHPDGLFGPRTHDVVREFQAKQGLDVDGIVGPKTWSILFGNAPSGAASVQTSDSGKLTPDLLEQLKAPHGFRDSVTWQLTDRGILVGGESTPKGTGGSPDTVRRIWKTFGAEILKWSVKLDVPAELIIATICTESSGKPEALRREPGFVSVESTPGKISTGLMQTLVSTARASLNRDDIDDRWLLEPGNSIQAGTSYITDQFPITGFDPPKVACAYNAGGVYYNDSPNNRWRMRQYPIGTSAHADRFVQWFNDCFTLFEQDKILPEESFFSMLRNSGGQA